MVGNYRKLVESIKLISLSFEDQAKCLPDFVEIPFEVLDIFDNVFLLLPGLIEKDQLTYRHIAEILRLFNLINFISSNPNFKDLDDEQFEQSEEWNKVRDFAKEILSLLGENSESRTLILSD